MTYDTTLTELKAFLKKHGYRLIDYRRFKYRDRLRLLTPEDIILTLSLKKHIEEIPIKNLLRLILTKDEYKKEFGENQQTI